MTIAALIAIGSAWLLGVLGVSVLWPRARPRPADLPVILPLGLGLGLALTSAIFFAASLMVTEPMRVSAALELLLGLGLAWCLWRRPRASVAPVTAPGKTKISSLAVAASVFVQASVVAVVVSARAHAAEPLGSWDGWAIWNMHARFMFRGGEFWSALLRQPQLGWTHPDYPLLVPSSVARVWACIGRDAPFASGLVSAMFGVATVGLLVAVTARLRNRLVALAGGLVLLGTPFFVTFSSNQHADIPLGFFILATVALIALGRDEPDAIGWPVLAGFAAGMAAWTKNEGLLFAVIAGLVWGIYAVRKGSPRSVGGFASGLVVALLPLLYFKHGLAPANDVVSGELNGRLSHVWEWPRHRLILTSFLRDSTRFGEWQVLPFLAMVFPLLGTGWRRLNGREWIAAVVVALMLLGYYGAYLITPWDLAWHLDFSLVRLLLQLWPAVIFFWCLAVTMEEPTAVLVSPPTSASRFRKKFLFAGILAANVAVAAAVLAAFARQHASNEFDVAQVEGGEVGAMIGDGWFERETDGRSLWVWSKGESTLLLRVTASQALTPVTLKFGVRALGERTVSAKIGERIIWQSRVGGEMSRAEVTGLALPAGLTSIVFATDQPGVPEAPNPAARTLSFALYDVRLK